MKNRIQCAYGKVSEPAPLSAPSHLGMGLLLGNKCNMVRLSEPHYEGVYGYDYGITDVFSL
ncbi:hypothetical protein [Paenibacillus sp. FSL R5-0470]|uniref:hypothetical protein n=1 Tax=Paenibacillus sp. FSL R5-0470 TaxID=2921641 RepID=UPI0030DA5C7A